LAKIALWKILVQLVFRLVQPVSKYWFSWYSKTSQPIFGPAQPDTQPVFSLVETGSTGFKTGSTGFKTGSTGFCTVHFFLPVCYVSQKAVCSFLKTSSTGFGTGSTGLCAEK
jgi:hypothetical protein